jgi:protein phosphatase
LTLWWGGTRKGSHRDENQDSFGKNLDQGLFILSDGMGGHAGGALASQKVVQSMLAPDPPDQTRGLRKWLDLSRRMQRAHSEVRNLAADMGQEGNMGATVVCVWLNHGNYLLGSVGDSRGYLLRENKMVQLTEDHTLMRKYQSQGVVTPEEAEVHPMRHVLLQAMGVDMVKPDVFEGELQAKDRFLLTSDGVHGVLSLEQMTAVMERAEDPEKAGQALLKLVDENQGQDDATVVVVFFDGEV